MIDGTNACMTRRWRVPRWISKDWSRGIKFKGLLPISKHELQSNAYKGYTITLDFHISIAHPHAFFNTLAFSSCAP
jgi:hypothetical protein